MTAVSWSGGLRDLLAGHDGVLLDLWGTLHDGASLYPGARDVLDGLAAEGIAVLLFSNAPRPAAFEENRLAAMGIAPAPGRAMLTAGEVWRAWWRRQGNGRAVFHCGPAGNLGLFDGLDLVHADVIEQAGILVVSDLDPRCGGMAGHRPMLAAALARGLVLHCINPDTDAVSPAGLVPRAGAVAECYAAMGGSVLRFGKPDRRAYGAALEILGDPPAGRVLAVGDAITTDIAGAHAVGMSCVLVASGRERDRLGLRGDDSDLARLAPLLPPGCRLLPNLRW
ncbi:MAG: TIGR01459 family HAD-type hydrolase [Proteobacteria bacterium]|nr:TIGR01459 family HAD-type hydrolase [Pseudomonadota bacterium]MDA0951647.1 TIGR01459 family HAD-type hydrolase [Pseudomonadota bacterium]